MIPCESAVLGNEMTIANPPGKRKIVANYSGKRKTEAK